MRRARRDVKNAERMLGVSRSSPGSESFAGGRDGEWEARYVAEAEDASRFGVVVRKF